MGIKGLMHNFKNELPHWSYIYQPYREVCQYSNHLTKEHTALNQNYAKLTDDYRRTTYLLMLIIVVLTLILAIKL